VILEHSVLGLHTCLVPVFLSFPFLLCIPCLGSTLQYTPLHLLSAFIYLVCITSTLIPASLRCTCFVIARQIFLSLSTFRANPITVHVRHYGQPTVTTIQKNNGETFTRKAQKDFPDGFHLDEELAGVISKSALAIDRGSSHFGPRYPGDERTNDHWLEGMGEDPEMVDLSKLLADTEVSIMGWKTVTSSKGSSSEPLPLVVQSTTEYSWMLGGKCIPLGFVNTPPPFEPLAEEGSSNAPSETACNA
jgi:hypothetical protein